MNHLRNLQELRARYGAIKRQIGQYWLDRMVDMYRRDGVAVGITGQVCAILQQRESGLMVVIPGLNIVTNDGDAYYAQKAGGETPTDNFTAGGLRLGSATTSPAKGNTDVGTFLAGTGHAEDASYPQTDDADGDNAGAGVDILTWRFSYLTSEGNANDIAEGAIVDNTTTPTAALSHFLFGAAFDKTSSDTLKVFVNHTFNGT